MSATGDGSLHHDRRRADSFGAVADAYDKFRPTYPDQLVDRLMAGEPGAVVDIGCGTGITARLFLRRGCAVLGVEPDPRMAAVARRHGVTIEEGTFEIWDAADRRFDLLVAGQAWHWVEPNTGARKAAEVLHPGGRIGLFWNQSFPDAAARAALDRVYQVLTSDLSGNTVALGARDEGRRYDAIARSLSDARFEDVAKEQFTNQVDYSTEQWVEMVATHSDHLLLPANTLARVKDGLRAAIDASGGQIFVRYETTLITGTVGDANHR